MNERQTLTINNQNHLSICGIDAVDLAKEYSTPLYVFDQKHLEDMCKTFSSALEKYYGYGFVSYASKAFSCKAIYRLIKDYNLGADVVSGGELYTAIKADFPTNKLIFHGNNKSNEELKFAIESGIGYIVIDSYTEAKKLNDLLEISNKTQDVLIRINPGVEAHTHHFIQTATLDSKFGFSIANGDAKSFIKQVLTFKNLNLKGLHCHIGSQIFEDESFLLAVEKMTDFYMELAKENITFEVLNLGGGFGIWYADGDKKLKPSDYDKTIKLIADKLNDCIIKKGIKKPYLILEPGRSIVGEAGITLYTVGSVKEIKGVKNYIAIDGGMFDNPRFALYQAKYTAVLANKMDKTPSKLYSIAGKCCESGDKITEDSLLPEVNEGDIIAVLSTGAYNYSMASNYNRNLIPPVIFVKDGVAKYAVKPQSYEDIIRNDV